MRKVVVPVIVTVEDGNRLSNVDVEELEDRKCPDAVKETIDKNRKTEDSRSIEELVYNPSIIRSR